MQSVPIDPSIERQVRFTLRPEDMVAAQRRHYKARLWSRASLVSYVASLGVVAALVAVAMRDAPWPWIAFVLGSAASGGVVVPLAMMRWYVPIVARRIYRQQRGLHREIAVEWDTTEFRATTERGGSRIAWTEYFRWREDCDIILLYHAENLFQMVPKRMLAEAQIDDLRSIAARTNLPGAGATRSAVRAAE